MSLNYIIIVNLNVFYIYLLSLCDSMTKPIAMDLYGSATHPTIVTAEGNQQVVDDKKEEGFDARHILPLGGSFVAQPPVNHTLDNALFKKTKKLPEEGFDSRYILPSGGSFVAQPPVSHALDDALFKKPKKLPENSTDYQ